MLAEAPPLPRLTQTLGMLATSARQLGSLSCPLPTAQRLSFADSDVIMSLPRLGEEKAVLHSGLFSIYFLGAWFPWLRAGSFWKLAKLGLAWRGKGRFRKSSKIAVGNLTHIGPVPPLLGFCPLCGVEKQLTR